MPPNDGRTKFIKGWNHEAKPSELMPLVEDIAWLGLIGSRPSNPGAGRLGTSHVLTPQPPFQGPEITRDGGWTGEWMKKVVKRAIRQQRADRWAVPRPTAPIVVQAVPWEPFEPSPTFNGRERVVLSVNRLADGAAAVVFRYADDPHGPTMVELPGDREPMFPAGQAFPRD